MHYDISLILIFLRLKYLMVPIKHMMRKAQRLSAIAVIILLLTQGLWLPSNAQTYACDAGPLGYTPPTITYLANTPLTLNVIFQNSGTDTIPAGALQVSCMVNYGIPSTATVPFAIPPGHIDSIPVSGVVFPLGFCNLCSYTTLACDTNLSNDSLCATVPAATFTTTPWFDDFETTTPCVSHPGSIWQWGVPSASIIDTAHSGTKAWATILNGTYPNQGEDYFYTPVFQFSQVLPTDTYKLSFWHWCAQADTGEVSRVEYSADTATTWNQLGFIMDPMGTNWYNAIHYGVLCHFFCYPNSGWIYSSYIVPNQLFKNSGRIRFRFKFSSNASGVSDGWAVDDMGFMKIPQPDDVGVVRIEEPVGPPALSAPGYTEIKPYISFNANCNLIYDLAITLKNFGSNPQTSIPVSYTLYNGGPVHSTTWTGTLLSGDTVLHTIPNAFPAYIGTQTVSAYTQLPTDIVLANDSSTKNYFGEIFYCMSVEEIENHLFIRLGQNIPNPASHFTTIPCSFPTAGKVIFGLTDQVGRVLFSEEKDVAVGEMEYTMNVSELTPGMYIYFAEFEGRKVSGKMMVLRD